VDRRRGRRRYRGLAALLPIAFLTATASAEIRVERTVEVGLNVPDSGGYIVSIFQFANPGVTNFSDVDVRLFLSSPDGSNPMWLGDLYSTLTYGTASESERVSVLLNRPGVDNTDAFGSALSSFDGWLDDAAATNVFFATNSTGSYQADGRIGVDPYAYPHPAFSTNAVTAGLSALNGNLLASQQWNLLVTDTAAAGVARFDRWRLAVTGGAATNGILDAGAGGSITGVGASNALGAVVQVGGTGLDATTVAVTNGVLDLQAGLQGAGHLAKTGAGTLTISAASAAFTGTVAAEEGTTQLAATGGAALQSVSDVSIASGATLLISTSNQVNDGAAITLSGGTIARGGGVGEVFGDLSLTADSEIDFGTGAAGTLRFAAYEGGGTPSHRLTIDSFLAGNVLIFGTDLSAEIAASYAGTSFSSSWFTINSASGGFTSVWSGSQFTITAVPEPPAVAAVCLLVALFAAGVLRRPAGRAAESR
jgi:autotransporter-associated beta strand protein